MDWTATWTGLDWTAELHRSWRTSSLSSEAELQNFIGKVVYIGHDSRAASGWFIGRVQSRNLSDADLKKTPSANFVINYTSKETKKAMNGKEARELSAATHGPARWWVELKKKAAV
jgi:hypothetical protein